MLPFDASLRIHRRAQDLRRPRGNIAITTHARWLFGIAAVFNLAVGAVAVFARSLLVDMFSLDAVGGSNILVFNLAGAFVALFGYAYLCIAVDPVKYRPFIFFGALGKLVAIACGLAGWSSGLVGWRFPGFLSADLLFVILFFDYLRRARP